MIYSKSTKRVLIIGIEWPPETFLINLINGLADRGVQIYLASGKRPSSDWLNKTNRHWLWMPSWNVNNISRIKNFIILFIKGIPAKPNQNKLFYQFIQKQPGLKNKIYRFYQVAPLINNITNIVYLPWVLVPMNILQWYEWIGMPIVISLRGSMVNVYPFIPGKGENIKQRLNYIFNINASIHCVSQDILQEAIMYGLKPEKSVIIRPAVDPDFFHVPVMKSKNNKFTIITVGSLIWRKGHEYALIALRRLVDEGVDAEFHIIGDGPEIERILYTIQDLDLVDQVIIHGKLPPNEVCLLLQNADVFLLTSHSEGISNAALEAMSCGLPVVTTDCGGMNEAVDDGVEGFVTPIRDPEAVASALYKLSKDSNLREKMGKACRRRIIKDFNLNNQVSEFIDLLPSTVEEI